METSAASSPPPAPAEADRALHARLLAGDVLASAELAETYLAPLVARLLRHHPHDDPHLVETAAIDAVLATAEHPERYNPARGSLATYLWIAARGDLRNARQSAWRRAAHHTPLDVVEIGPAARNLATGADDPADVAARRRDRDPGLVATARAAFDAREWAVVELMIDGERRPTADYARLLGLEHLPAPDRAREVKRVKDRLEKRLRRLAPRVKRDD
jgi:RNA polymerase sigma-70 factor (ECF subfamily)